MSNSNHVVRARSFWKGRAALCAIVFVATGLAVHQLARDRFARANAHSSATAIVYHAFAPPTAGQLPPPTTEEIKRQVLSDGGLQRALARGSGHAGGYLLDTIGQARRTLRVVVREDVGRDRFKILITAQDSDVARAVRLANSLAKQYADHHAADFRATVEAEHLRASNLAQRSQRALIARRNQLDEFLRSHFKARTTDSSRAAPSPPVADQFVGLARLSDRMIENPAWTDWNQQLLRQRKMRSELALGTVRTNPRVRALDDRIAELEQRLAVTPREIPELEVVRRLPETTSSDERARSTRAPANSDTAATSREYSSFQETLRSAADEHDRLVLLERRAWERRVLLPGVEVYAAEMPADVTQLADRGPSPRAVLLALASALAMAAGVAMISSGVASDPALCDAAEVESMLPAPLVGGIPCRTPVASRPSTRAAGGMTLLFYGMLFVMVCFGVLLALFGPGL